jgi:hypothetical protein
VPKVISNPSDRGPPVWRKAIKLFQIRNSPGHRLHFMGGNLRIGISGLHVCQKMPLGEMETAYKYNQETCERHVSECNRIKES